MLISLHSLYNPESNKNAGDSYKLIHYLVESAIAEKNFGLILQLINHYNIGYESSDPFGREGIYFSYWLFETTEAYGDAQLMDNIIAFYNVNANKRKIRNEDYDCFLKYYLLDVAAINNKVNLFKKLFVAYINNDEYLQCENINNFIIQLDTLFILEYVKSHNFIIYALNRLLFEMESYPHLFTSEVNDSLNKAINNIIYYSLGLPDNIFTSELLMLPIIYQNYSFAIILYREGFGRYLAVIKSADDFDLTELYLRPILKLIISLYKTYGEQSLNDITDMVKLVVIELVRQSSICTDNNFDKTCKLLLNKIIKTVLNSEIYGISISDSDVFDKILKDIDKALDSNNNQTADHNSPKKNCEVVKRSVTSIYKSNSFKADEYNMNSARPLVTRSNSELWTHQPYVY